MLEGLDTINWKKLTHAYGPADDVPDQIRGLLSANVKTRETALWELYGNIFHQGTRYQATPFAVPFLYELIEYEGTPERETLIILLVNLALGYEEQYLPGGVDIEKFRNELIETEKNISPAERKESEEFGFSAQALLDIYDNVQKGIPILQKLVFHIDEKIRRAAIYALTWFPENAGTSIEIIFAHLRSLTEERDISNALLAIGLLARSSHEKLEESAVRHYLGADSLLVRVSAAICLATAPLEDSIMDKLIQGVLSGEEFEYVPDSYFNGGDFSGYTGLVLAKFGAAEKQKVIPALCQALESVAPYQSLDITRAILTILNKGRKVPIQEIPSEELEDIEFIALHAILNHGGWELGTSKFVNFSELLESEGIPDSREELSRYLGC